MSSGSRGPMDLASPTSMHDDASVMEPGVEQALAVRPDPAAAAFFDVDNTVMRGASIFHLARGLAARKFFSSRDIVGFAWEQLKFLTVGNEDPDAMADATEAALGFVKGRSVAEINRLGDEIFTEIMVDKLWPGTLALAQGHLDAGQRVWLVTASPVELATIIATRLGLTGALGTVSEIRDGIYTGRLLGAPLHGQAKADAVRALAEREGLDLARCSAYSDSVNDVPMLSVVGHPVAVNPDAALRGHARAEGWAVRDYRRARMRRRVGIPAGVVAGAALVAGVAIGVVVSSRRRR